MSDAERKEPGPGEDPGGDRPTGPSLTLLYSLIGLALVAAVGLAALIVLPFYLRR
ncbi:MAG: hypothetical protein ACLQG3_11440 [Terracidiphilus sp.]